MNIPSGARFRQPREGCQENPTPFPATPARGLGPRPRIDPAGVGPRAPDPPARARPGRRLEPCGLGVGRGAALQQRVPGTPRGLGPGRRGRHHGEREACGPRPTARSGTARAGREGAVGRPFRGRAVGVLWAWRGLSARPAGLCARRSLPRPSVRPSIHPSVRRERAAAAGSGQSGARGSGRGAPATSVRPAAPPRRARPGVGWGPVLSEAQGCPPRPQKSRSVSLPAPQDSVGWPRGVGCCLGPRCPHPGPL